MKRIDLTGQKFGRLTVIEYIGSDEKGKPYYKCLCDCGKETKCRGENLKGNRTKSCGCYNLERSIEVNTTHGDSRNRIYHEWLDMRKRCNNPKNKEYHNYGERGIKVCDEWESDYNAYKAWALNNGYADNLTIERIDVDKNYEPSNCKWIPMIEQCINKRIQNNNTTGVKGVTFKNGKYIVRISYKKKRYYIGAYETLEEAKINREKAEKEVWGR